MDIRSIIDSEDTPPTRKPSIPLTVKQEYRLSPTAFSNSQTLAYDNRREIRPPQPSPLKTPSYTDAPHTSAFPLDSIRSPHQRTPLIGLSNGHYPPLQAPSQSPQYVHQALQYTQRENAVATGPQSGRSIGNLTPLTQTPTASTPGSASVYSTFPRPTSSHSIPTPNSTQHTSSFLRESPQPSLTQSRSLSQPQGVQHYTSQPGTPLGPPSTHGRPSLTYHRSSPGTQSSHRSPSVGHPGHQEFVSPSAATSGSPSGYRERQPSANGYGGPREREDSLSVSPKTRLPSLSGVGRLNSFEGHIDAAVGDQVIPVQRENKSETPGFEVIREPRITRTPSRSVGLSGLLNAEPSSNTTVREHHLSREDSFPSQGLESEVQLISQQSASQHLQLHSSTTPLTSTPQNSQDTPIENHSTHIPAKTNQTQLNTLSSLHANPEKISSFKMAALKTSNSLTEAPMPQLKKASRAPKKAKRPIQELSGMEVVENATELQNEPVTKRARLEDKQDISRRTPDTKPQLQPKSRKPPRITHWQDLPIFAQSVRGPQRTMELFQQNLQSSNRTSEAMQPPSASSAKPPGRTNGNVRAHFQVPLQSSPANILHKSAGQVLPTSDGPLGLRYPTFNNTIPADALTTRLANFIFLSVVNNSEVGVAPAGGGRGLGAVLEVEARIGRLIDRNTNDRLYLPVEGEWVISQKDPNLRIAFESSMTEHQHRNLNIFLNRELVESQAPKSNSGASRKSRIPMSYKHTHEIDTTYELSQRGALQLPHSVANGLNLGSNARNKARVRVTTDEKTGEVLAKIVKSKVADIHVYCPDTLFDWRISINAEMDFDIDMKDLVAIETRDGNGVRKKDRVSYKHLAYQFDLTQVTPAEPANKMDKVHELEVEISSEEIRKQGLLLQNMEPNDYEDLIGGFVNNVRVLARFCKE